MSREQQLLGVSLTVGWAQAGMMREGWKKYQKSSATDRDVARHICFTHDYMYNVLDTSPLPGGRAIWINDLKGVPRSGVLYSSCAFCVLTLSCLCNPAIKRPCWYILRCCLGNS